MKNFIAVFILTFAVGFTGALNAGPFSKKDGRKNWQGYDQCKVRCEKKDDCISKKTDSGPKGRTACSERCDDLCDEIDTEKGG